MIAARKFLFPGVLLSLVLSAGHSARADDTGAIEYRALSAAAHNKYEDAIALYTQALESSGLTADDRAALENKRGVAYASAGQVEKAITDFDSVIRLKPHYIFAYFNRGAALDGMGRYDAAIADFDAVLHDDPESSAAFFVRGQALFHTGRFALAAADFARDVERAPADALAVAWLYLAERRVGAKTAAESLTKNAAAVDLKQWPGPVLAFYLGNLTAPELRAAAASAIADIQSDRACQAEYYIGEAALLAHGAGEARQLFTQMVQHCPVTLAEYVGARAELAQEH